MPDFYILDAGVLFSTWPMGVPDGRFLTTPAVLDEIQNRPSKTRIDTMSALNRLFDEQPDPQFVILVASAAKKTGDALVLSEADIELIALGLEKMRSGNDVVLVSTDLAILNTASRMRIPIIDPSRRFKKQIRWKMRCPGCGHISTRFNGCTECPVCGTPMRRNAARR